MIQHLHLNIVIFQEESSHKSAMSAEDFMLQRLTQTTFLVTFAFLCPRWFWGRWVLLQLRLDADEILPTKCPPISALPQSLDSFPIGNHLGRDILWTLIKDWFKMFTEIDLKTGRISPLKWLKRKSSTWRSISARMCPGWLTNSFSCFNTADLAWSKAAFRHPRTRVDGAFDVEDAVAAVGASEAVLETATAVIGAKEVSAQ